MNKIIVLLLFAFLGTAQAQTTTAESLDKLRAQLLEVQEKEEALRERAQQLDEALKPENIERSLAGVGSTKPEELRESRRKQLQIERDSVAAQLQILETSRTRLEAAILNAETQLYHQSARPTPETDQVFVLRELPWSGAWLISGGAGFVVAGLLAGVWLRRRLRHK